VPLIPAVTKPSTVAVISWSPWQLTRGPALRQTRLGPLLYGREDCVAVGEAPSDSPRYFVVGWEDGRNGRLIDLGSGGDLKEVKEIGERWLMDRLSSHEKLAVHKARAEAKAKR
jgi:hypothetical protein